MRKKHALSSPQLELEPLPLTVKVHLMLRKSTFILLANHKRLKIQN
jgi:hypothetical protein